MSESPVDAPDAGASRLKLRRRASERRHGRVLVAVLVAAVHRKGCEVRVDDRTGPRDDLARRGEALHGFHRQIYATAVTAGVRLEPHGQVRHELGRGVRGQVGQRFGGVLGREGTGDEGVERGRPVHAVEGLDGSGGDTCAVKRSLGGGRGRNGVPLLGRLHGRSRLLSRSDSLLRSLNLTCGHLLDGLRRRALLLEERLEACLDVGAIDVVPEAEERVQVGEPARGDERRDEPERLAGVGQVSLIHHIPQRRPQLTAHAAVYTRGEHDGRNIHVLVGLVLVEHLLRRRRRDRRVAVKLVHHVLRHFLGGWVGTPPPVLTTRIPTVDDRLEGLSERVCWSGRRLGELWRVNGVLIGLGHLPHVCNAENLYGRTRGTVGTCRQVQPAQHRE